MITSNFLQIDELAISKHDENSCSQFRGVRGGHALK